MVNFLIPIQASDIVVKHTIEPISEIDAVKNIFILRDEPGPEIKKVTYVSVPKNILKVKFLVQIYKIFLGLILCKREKIDIVAPYYILPHGLIGSIVGKLRSIPVVFSLMGNAEEIVYARKDLGPLGFIVNYLLFNYSIITTTGSVGKKYLVELGIKNNKINHLPDSIDTNKFVITNTEKLYDIVSLGRLAAVKNLKTLLLMLFFLKKVKINVKVCIVGSGPESHFLQRLSKKLGLDSNVDFLGYRTDTHNYFSKSLIYICSSIHEGMPMSMLEAMASGTAVITSNVGDISDLAVHKHNCLLVEDPYDTIQFYNHTLELLNNENLREKLFVNARSDVEDRYGYTGASKSWIRTIKKLGIKI